MTDQRGVVHTYVYDALGRLSMDQVTTCPSGVDDTVLCIETTYDARGRVEHVRSYDSDDNSGVVLNDVQMEYNGFNQLTKEYQEHAGAVNTSTTPKVQYGYEPGAASSVQTNNIRPTTLTYPNGRVITYQYGTADGLNDYLNRPNEVYDTTNTQSLATYEYLGSGLAVRVKYPEPSVMLDLWGTSETTGTFAGLDDFNRVTDQLWRRYGGTTTTLDQYTYTYDRNSNRLTRGNGTHADFDEAYTYDNLNRLTSMVRGDSSINFTEAWNLDETGNWLSYDTTSDGTTSTLSQTRTTNTANEITDITSTPTWADPSYDAAGNMTAFLKPGSPGSNLTATYDAWNRLVKVADGSSTVVEYEYDGERRRVVRLAYTGGTLSQNRHFYFSSHWQDIEQRLGSASSPEHQFIWGLRYLDEMICRDDSTPARRFTINDVQFSVTAIADHSGVVLERFAYAAYGHREILSSSWIAVPTSGYDWLIGFEGLYSDAATRTYLVRLRTYPSTIGSWVQRDPLDAPRGASLYEFLGSAPTDRLDPYGADFIQPSPGLPNLVLPPSPFAPFNPGPITVPTSPVQTVPPTTSPPIRVVQPPDRNSPPLWPLLTPLALIPFVDDGTLALLSRCAATSTTTAGGATLGSCLLTSTGVGAIVCCEIVVAGITTGILCHWAAEPLRIPAPNPWTGTPEPELDRPLAGWKTCTVRCNVHGSEPHCQNLRVEATGRGSTRREACEVAEAAAKKQTPRGCYPRHCHALPE